MIGAKNGVDTVSISENNRPRNDMVQQLLFYSVWVCVPRQITFNNENSFDYLHSTALAKGSCYSI